MMAPATQAPAMIAVFVVEDMPSFLSPELAVSVGYAEPAKDLLPITKKFVGGA